MPSLDEREIERLARRIGTEAESQIDPDATAHAVLERLKLEGREEPRRHPLRNLRIVAVAAVVVLAAGIGFLGRGRTDTENSWASSVPDGLLSLSMVELEEVFDSLSFEAPISETAAVGMDDLSEAQLEELLISMMEE